MPPVEAGAAAPLRKTEQNEDENDILLVTTAERENWNLFGKCL